MPDDLFHDPSLTNLTQADQRVVLDIAQRLAALEALSGHSPEQLADAQKDAEAQAANERAAMLATFESSLGGAVQALGTDLGGLEERIVRRLMAALRGEPTPVATDVPPTSSPESIGPPPPPSSGIVLPTPVPPAAPVAPDPFVTPPRSGGL